MQLTNILTLLTVAGTSFVSAGPVPVARQAGGQVDTSLIPTDFGFKAGDGKDKVQVGSCTGAANKPIPCDCPPAPDNATFIGDLSTALNQGFFPDPSITVPINLTRFNDKSDTSAQTNRDRATAMVQVLQSLSGTKGVGCPGAAFPVLIAQQQTGQVGGSTASVGNAGRV
ncbi:hypothetical protein QBC46DRAFT_83320 [Diplogelasinospora grovesii]|uniref:Uncharacterized protein n=1 Tax=Diplogelasinospora grovesii TaxID=303347 RepID=A0AAN6RZ96_9PEZI|nr:hypothetical protein QBC46DRAFT_83320 [Diplogelasinospora grovesii]